MWKANGWTDGRRTLTHDKSSHGLWPGELKNILPLDEGVRVINTLCEQIIILDFVSGDNFLPHVLMYPNTFIQGQYVYNIKLLGWLIVI